jgi:hypothetical protein
MESERELDILFVFTTFKKVPKLGAGQDDFYELSTLQNVPSHPNVLGLLGICLSFMYNGRISLAILVPLKLGGSLQSLMKKRRGETFNILHPE